MNPTNPGQPGPADHDDARGRKDRPGSPEPLGDADPAQPVGAVVVPDDARELARDVEAWRREQRWQRRRQRLERWLVVRTVGERRIPGPLIFALLVLVVAIGATMSMLAPREVHAPTPPVPLDLAAPTTPAGKAGGLLPDVPLLVSDGTTEARLLRPAVVAIISPDCRCTAALANLAAQAAPDGLTVFAVGASNQRTAVDQIAGQVGRANVQTAIDPTGTLVSAYAPVGLTVVPVHADGVTGTIMRSFSADARITSELNALKQPAAP